MQIYEQAATADRMGYGIARPDSCQGLPLLIYLHGAGERGTTLSHLYRHAIPKMIAEGQELPALVLYPQCPAARIWNNVVEPLYALIEEVIRTYDVPHDRILLTGSSMGGYGTWEMAMCYPELFAAAAPVAGGGVVWRTSKLQKIPILAYHGAEDDTVPPSQSEIMVEYTNRLGGQAELTLLSGYGHNDGIDYAYRHTDLLPRLLSYHKQDFSRVPEPFEEFF